ncbi:adenylate/guanylate cyclase domain-containing protein [Nitrosopumilus sp. b1]|uniref:adenylate/guanylate cyclase domain-containing protein n=1 Tax=Nitrosopumilus sp. b1 TaxID=2109907 RepID=UPI001C71148F|nr:adenylate/guanylate cyclase domain-containing protein [Nitrosopumilus sp. b1]KAF6242584.1 adenylate/guanylate cyclase domain-containing protein [Nitrosopumilus sp. b1]
MSSGGSESWVKNFANRDFFNYDFGTDQKAIIEEPKKLSPDPEPNISDYLVAFSTNSQNYCVGVVDMVNSTKISATLGPEKASRYYQIFLNSMSKVLSRFGGFVIKNIGDCLMYYFPESVHSDKKFGFISCIECSIAMTDVRGMLCQKLASEGLPCLDYRVSADYGSVIIMKSNNSDTPDMIGPPVNMCSKINRFAPRNGVVIGGDLYEMVKDLKFYKFEQVKGYSVGFKQSYPVYKVKRK